MSGVFSVGFPAGVIRAVRQFARQDGVRMSEWIRNLVAAELKSPQRTRVVDVNEYPLPQTIASGGISRIEWEYAGAAPGSVTGCPA